MHHISTIINTNATIENSEGTRVNVQKSENINQS